MASSSQANNQVSYLIAHIVNNELNPLRNEIVSLKGQLNQNIKKVEDSNVRLHSKLPNHSGNFKEMKTNM